MRILMISNHYPPYAIGGYELSCADTANALREYGHQVAVLTSVYGVAKPIVDQDIFRWLYLSNDSVFHLLPSSLSFILRELFNQFSMQRVIKHFRPDIVLIWNMSGLSKSLIAIAECKELICSYSVGDFWLKHWTRDRWYQIWSRSSDKRANQIWKALLKYIFSVVPLGIITKYEIHPNNLYFISEFAKVNTLDHNITPQRVLVIPRGVDTAAFRYRTRLNHPLRLLFVGRLVPNKGADCVIDALEVLVNRYGKNDLRLTIVGAAPDPHYMTALQTRIAEYRLYGNVVFRGAIDWSHMPHIYQDHDIFIFASDCNEALGRTILEAMACGLGIVSNGDGGSNEITRDGVNALLYEKRNAQDCAEKIVRLVGDLDLLETLRRNGRTTVEERFSRATIMQVIENELKSLVLSQQGRNPPDS